MVWKYVPCDSIWVSAPVSALSQDACSSSSGNCNPCFISSAKVILISASVHGQGSISCFLFTYVQYVYIKPNILEQNSEKKIITKQNKPQGHNFTLYKYSVAFLKLKKLRLLQDSVYPSIHSSIHQYSVIYPKVSKAFPSKINCKFPSGVCGASDSFGVLFTFGRIKQ